MSGHSKKAEIIDEDDRKIGAVEVPTDDSGLMSKRIMIGLQVYESQLDDYCCFKGYMAVPVTRIDEKSVQWETTVPRPASDGLVHRYNFYDDRLTACGVPCPAAASASSKTCPACQENFDRLVRSLHAVGMIPEEKKP